MEDVHIYVIPVCKMVSSQCDMFGDGMNVPEDFNIIDFPCGLYAVATEIDN